ncbi:ATP-binding protein [Streptomyces olivaceus]|uniref:Pro-rich N-terminal domain-containing protein n=2 Tax=Streptomyces olivaceus TaxID=47716 RepID=UPI001CCD237A|nr:Pro-rich N-terminal domain-containing protein [Streptomyces olivaceus]MBZ6290239.1 ATP-binding protein [Streptomyces olivaceus]MBZ6324191.1 ATP-binding protein [Streptomyces olivaceus]
MQHAVGSPLPPPHQPGHGPAVGWSPAAHQPGPPQGPAPVPPPPPPAPGYPTAPLRAPAPHPGPAPGQGPQPHAAPGQGAQQPSAAPRQAPGPQQPPVAPSAPSAPPVPETTGHVPLPPGGPVAVPSVPPATAAPDPTTTTLAVLLIGPAGAGKTSVAKYWADHRRVPTAHISLDDVREWVRSGFADPQTGWNEHSEAQYRLARRTCGFSARNFLANGISCILDDAVFPDRPVVGLGGWKRHVGPGLLPVVLLPGLDIVLERNAERSGNRRLTDEEVARIHGRMAGWYGSGLPIIDNSQLDVPETAYLLDEVLSRSIASPPNW